MHMIPSFYQPDKVGTLYEPRAFEAAAAGAALKLKPASSDQQRVLLLLVDPQVDFIHEDGALSVPGAVDDTRRTVEWIFSHAEQITTIAASLDSHVPIQIFSPSWWVGQDGQNPPPYTVITAADVDAGVWMPLYEEEWSRQYVHKLEQQAKKELMIWPYHTLIGTPGHAITPALYEAIAFHSAARQSQPVFLTKGSIPKTEYYSMIEPEVKVPEEAHGGLNEPFLKLLASYDRIYVAGQAKSHCVMETMNSITRYFHDVPAVLSRFYLLMDCMSSVAHPQIDFDALANARFAEFEKLGLHLVTSKD